MILPALMGPTLAAPSWLRWLPISILLLEVRSYFILSVFFLGALSKGFTDRSSFSLSRVVSLRYLDPLRCELAPAFESISS